MVSRSFRRRVTRLERRSFSASVFAVTICDAMCAYNETGTLADDVHPRVRAYVLAVQQELAKLDERSDEPLPGAA